jgi:hypothetical protein
MLQAFYGMCPYDYNQLADLQNIHSFFVPDQTKKKQTKSHKTE